MKKIFILLTLLFPAATLLTAQADRITGFWLTSEGESQIRIYSAGNGSYNGRISWLEEPYENGRPKIDDDNPDPSLRNRPILGLEILTGFEYNGKGKEWRNGTIYDPKSGKTYDCYIWFEDDPDVLYLKGFVMGMRILGRSTQWKRENDRNK